ncbi:MAG: class I SAM-dependent methyltransferase, partial [Cyclobacteriaceae bacterium]|nr:class I SAM-dependent methyltransferase [Cyclobacteriaceae bacterium]
ALRKTLANISFEDCLELGCGTGKNTAWFVQKAKHVTAVDLSDEMLSIAKKKLTNDNVKFISGDITAAWSFRDRLYDLISFSLVLEHISDLNSVFKEAAISLKPGGCVYVGELHPYKQYTGTKARFETGNGTHVLPCFDHHTSDFIQIPGKYGLTLLDVNEYFDDDDRRGIPRILVVLLKKS